MSRDQLSQYLGIFGLALIAIAATLYAINSPQRLLTYATLATGIAVLAVFAIMNARAIAEFSKRRSARQGANTLVMIVLFVAIVVVLQALSARHAYRYDLTANKRFSLADQTLAVLAGLQEDVFVTGFYQKAGPLRESVKDLVEQYAHASERIRYEFIDPDQKPQAAADMGINNYNTLVVRFGNKKEMLSNVTEETFTNALLKITRDTAKTVYFVIGHSERDPGDPGAYGYSIARDAIETQNYIVQTVNLFDAPAVPDDCSVLIVAGPNKEYFPAEIEKIEAYLAAGRNALLMLDPKTEVEALKRLVAAYGIRVDENVIVDPYSRVFGGEYTVPVVATYENHPITLNFEVASFYPLARSISVADTVPPGSTAKYLAKTGKSAWGENDLELVSQGQAVRSENDMLGPLGLAVAGSRRFEAGEPALHGSDESQIVVFGDSDFADNRSFRMSGNADFLLNTINFLAEEKDLIAIRARRGMGDRLFLTASQGNLVFLVSVVLVPLSVAALGASVFVRGRRRG